MARSSSLRDKHVPRKRFGQHFITDRNILNKIVNAAELQASEVVLEIGPGLGHLTRALAERGVLLVSVEVDRELAQTLRLEFSTLASVTIAEGDFMGRSPEEWLAQAQLKPPYKVVANLPYYITSPILRRLLEAETQPTRLVIMVQREVAQHIVAKPPHANLLGTSVQFYGTPRIVGIVPAGAFYPRPKVDSAIVRIDVERAPTVYERQRFFQVVRSGFGGKRKQLRNALAHGLDLSNAQALFMLGQANIHPARRAETLTLDEWDTLARAAGLVQERS